MGKEAQTALLSRTALRKQERKMGEEGQNNEEKDVFPFPSIYKSL